MKEIVSNKGLKTNYDILEKFTAGIVLSGPEVKSIKAGQINLKGSYISVNPGGEVWLVGAHIASYKPAASVQKDYQPNRARKLLLKKEEIDYLKGKLNQKGLTILPISVYTKGSLIKIELALVKGKKKHDKREALKKREIEREIRRKMRRKS